MRLAFDCDAGSSANAALGLIVLKADETIERELAPLFRDDGVTLFHARIESAPEVTPETLLQMKERLAETSALFPAQRPMDVIAYACTSGATVIGSKEVERQVRKAFPSAKVTNPAEAIIAACHHLGVTRIGLVSPYVAEVSDALCALLAENGIETPLVGSFEQAEEAVVARIALHSVEEAVCQIGASGEVEAVFASCTNLRTLDVVPACEARIGKPVLSSNLALAWHMRRLAGLKTQGTGPGRLFAS